MELSVLKHVFRTFLCSQGAAQGPKHRKTHFSILVGHSRRTSTALLLGLKACKDILLRILDRGGSLSNVVDIDLTARGATPRLLVCWEVYKRRFVFP